MIDIKRHGILISKTNFEFENEGVLNPAVIRVGNKIHMFYRAVQIGNRSTIGYCMLSDPTTIAERWEKPIIVPEFEYEAQGVEDARIVKIDDLYYLSYTAYDGINALGALAISKNLKKFKKHGIVVPPITYAEFVFRAENSRKVNERYYRNHKFYFHESDPGKKMMLWDKNVVFFPRRIDGKLFFLHRIRPGIQLVSIDNLTELTYEFWIYYFLNLQDHIVMDPIHAHEAAYIGSGCPPIETEHGWLFIYHGVQETEQGLIYSACAALLDLNNPLKEIARLPYPLFSPVEEWELTGEVNNVVFPTGTALFDDTLYIYYGAADSHIATASLSISELLDKLLTYTKENEKLNTTI